MKKEIFSKCPKASFAWHTAQTKVIKKQSLPLSLLMPDDGLEHLPYFFPHIRLVLP